ncbi:developmentally-regulated protein [Acrasis kona]|uniref:Developmentally-regulated protein n=1 Tax=Acrasis kona TaxID=1008807 RepID=A0AAW2ZPS1_9EUKA
MQRRRRRTDEEGSGSEAEEDYESDQSYDPEAEEHDDVNDDEKNQDEIQDDGAVHSDEEEHQDEEEIDYVETLEEAKPSAQDSPRGAKSQRGTGRGSRGRGSTTPEPRRPGSSEKRPVLRGAMGAARKPGRGRGRGRGVDREGSTTPDGQQQGADVVQLDANNKPIRKRRERKRFPKDGQAASEDQGSSGRQLSPTPGAGRGDNRPQLRGAKVKGVKRMGRGQSLDQPPSSPTHPRGRGRGQFSHNHQPINSKRYSVQRQQDGNDPSNDYRHDQQEYYNPYQQNQYVYYDYPQQPIYHSPTPLFVPEYAHQDTTTATVAPSTSSIKLNANSKAYVPKQFQQQQEATTDANNES